MAYVGNSAELKGAADEFAAALEAYVNAKGRLNSAITEALATWGGSAAEEMAKVQNDIQTELDKIDTNLDTSRSIFNQSATDNDATDTELANAIKKI